MTQTRRTFLGQAATAAVTACGSLALNQCLAADPEPIPIVDTHQHLWDLKRFELPWLNGAPEVLKRTYEMPDYLAATAGLPLQRAVYMEVDVAPRQQVEEAEYLLEICRAGKSPTVGAVISGRPGSAAFGDYIRKYGQEPRIKGVRQVLHAPEAKAGLCLEPQFVKSVQLLGELGKSFDLCMRPGELGDGVRLVEQCPETRFVVDHCGNADPKAFLSEAARGGKPASHSVENWKRDMAGFARHERVICKISGIVASVPEGTWTAEILAPIINYCLDTFGPDRVVFGGDWPVCLLGASYRRWVESLREVVRQRPLEHQHRLWHRNATKFYSLDT